MRKLGLILLVLAALVALAGCAVGSTEAGRDGELSAEALVADIAGSEPQAIETFCSSREIVGEAQAFADFSAGWEKDAPVGAPSARAMYDEVIKRC
jgi:hypothetical protein